MDYRNWHFSFNVYIHINLIACGKFYWPLNIFLSGWQWNITILIDSRIRNELSLCTDKFKFEMFTLGSNCFVLRIRLLSFWTFILLWQKAVILVLQALIYRYDSICYMYISVQHLSFLQLLSYHDLIQTVDKFVIKFYSIV